METDKKYTIVYNYSTDVERKIKIEYLSEYLDNGYEQTRRPFTQEHKDKIGNSNRGKSSPLKGKKHPKEVGEKVSKAKTGVKHTEEQRKANSEAQKKCRWFNNGIEEKKCFPENCPEGWVPKRLPMKKTQKDKLSKSHKGKKLSKEALEIRASKEYLTKKKNNSFNTSKPEEELYNFLLNENINKTIFRRYKDKERYPFYCDFYIVEDDLFIELNAHWTHGGKPYDPEDKECQEKLAIWQEKAKTSQFYANAIETWTVRDVEKQRVAKENNLNYKVIY